MKPRPAGGEVYSAYDRNDFSISALSGILHHAVGERIKSIILGMTDVFAGMDIGASLTHNNRTGINPLSAEGLNAHPLTLRVTSILYRSLPFFVSQLNPLSLKPLIYEFSRTCQEFFLIGNIIIIIYIHLLWAAS